VGLYYEVPSSTIWRFINTILNITLNGRKLHRFNNIQKSLCSATMVNTTLAEFMYNQKD